MAKPLIRPASSDETMREDIRNGGEAGPRYQVATQAMPDTRSTLGCGARRPGRRIGLPACRGRGDAAAAGLQPYRAGTV